VVNAVAARPQGDLVYITGYSSSDETGADFTTVALESGTGQVVWHARHQGETQPTEFPSDHANALVVSPDGSALFVAGWQDLYGIPTGPQQFKAYADMGLVAYDAVTGRELWTASYGAPYEGGDDRAYDVAVGPQGDRVFITGRSSGEGTKFDYATVAFDTGTGERLWAARYDGPFATEPGPTTGEDGLAPDDRPYRIRVSPDGDEVFVTGWSRSAAGDYDIATIAYDSGVNDTEEEEHGGEVLWTSRFDGGVSGLDGVFDMEVNSDGSLIHLAGYTTRAAAGDSCSDCDFLALTLDAETGQQQWSRRYAGPRGNDTGYYIEVSLAGDRVFVSGASPGVQGDWATLGYDARTGEELWVSRYNSPTPDTEDSVRGLAMSPDGRTVIVTGYSANPVFNGPPKTYLHADAVTVAYDAEDGSQEWIARHNASPLPLDTYAEDLSFIPSTLVVDPTGARAFVGRTYPRGFVDSYTYEFGAAAYDL